MNQKERSVYLLIILALLASLSFLLNRNDSAQWERLKLAIKAKDEIISKQKKHIDSLLQTVSESKTRVTALEEALDKSRQQVENSLERIKALENDFDQYSPDQRDSLVHAYIRNHFSPADCPGGCR